MYAELTLTLKFVPAHDAILAGLSTIVGNNRVPPKKALAGTSLAHLAHHVLIAEQFGNDTTVAYLMMGPDTVVADILVQSLGQLRAQCIRITRQISSQKFPLDAAHATISVTGDGSDVVILKGAHLSFIARCWEEARSRFIGTFIPALTTVMLTVKFMTEATALTSAMIGLAAACAGMFIDATVAAVANKSWTWKEFS
jgi:hypothetical protein